MADATDPRASQPPDADPPAAREPEHSRCTVQRLTKKKNLPLETQMAVPAARGARTRAAGAGTAPALLFSLLVSNCVSCGCSTLSSLRCRGSWAPRRGGVHRAEPPTECTLLLACFFPSYAPGSGDTAPARVAGAPSGTARGRPDSHSRLVLRGGSGAFWGSPPVKVSPRNIHLSDARASLLSLSSWPLTSLARRLRPRRCPDSPSLPCPATAKYAVWCGLASTKPAERGRPFRQQPEPAADTVATAAGEQSVCLQRCTAAPAAAVNTDALRRECLRRVTFCCFSGLGADAVVPACSVNVACGLTRGRAD